MNYLDELLILQSCWRAFEETMKANGMTEEQISKFVIELSMRDVHRNVREALTISLEESE